MTWSNADLKSQTFYGIHLGVNSQEIPINLIRIICLEIILLKSAPHLSGVNELFILCAEFLAATDIRQNNKSRVSK